MKPGFPRPARAGEDTVGAAVRAVPPLVPDHTLIQLIGRGSYGEVWLARNVLGALRAVKVVHRQAFEDERPYEREFIGIKKFEPVSRTHEGLVDLLQVGRNDKAEHYYYVMEVADEAASNGSAKGNEWASEQLTPSSPLAAYTPKTLAHEIALRGALPVEECISLALSLAGAVAHLHRHGLIHRDIKPSNTIFVNGQIKLADIGLVSEVGDSRSYVGTEGYIPPEGPGTRQADLYSLGKLIYEAGTGKDRTEFPVLPVELIRSESGKRLLELNAVFVKACAQDPRQRYQSAEELQADLALLQSGKSVRHLRTVERRLRLMTRLGVLGLVLAALAGGAYGFAKRQSRLDRENLLRIERAEKEARTQLRQALFSQAQALRRSGQSGQRFESLAALRKAIAIEAPASAAQLLEFRNEAIAAMMLADLRLATPEFLAGGVTNVSVDGRFEYYARGNSAGNVQVGRVSDDKVVVELNRPSAAVQFVHYFSPEGRFLPVSYRDGQLWVWDVERAQPRLKVPSNVRPYRLDFSPNSERLAIGDEKGALLICDLPQAKVIVQTNLGMGWLSVRFNHDGRELGLFSAASKDVWIADTQTARVKTKLAHAQGVQGMAWSADGIYIATACDDRKAYLWDSASHRPAFVLSGHQSAVTQVDFHPNGQLLASASWDGTTRLWDLANGESLLSLSTAGKQLRFSRDGRHLTFYGRDGRALFVCEVAGERACRLLRKRALAQQDLVSAGLYGWSVAFSPDDALLAGAYDTDGVQVWDAKTERHLAHLPAGRINSVFFSRDGKSLLAAGDAGLLRWPTAKILAGDANPTPERLSESGKVIRACPSPQGAEVAYIRDNEVHLVEAGRKLNGLSGLNFVQISPNGRWLAASTWFRNGGRLWELPSGKHVRDFARGQSVNIAFSPDSRWLITSEGEAYRFWDVETGQPGHGLPLQNGAQVSVEIIFTRDGRMLACMSSPSDIQLRDAEAFGELALLRPVVPQMVSGLAFDSRADRLAVATATPFVQLWNLRMLRQQLAELELDWAPRAR